MAKEKYDAVLQAVHYKPDGQVDWARTYQRRGPIWSDYVIKDRQGLIDDLNSGRRYMVGQRVPYMAGTFEVSEPLRYVKTDGDGALVAGDSNGTKDHLEGVPVI